MIEKLTEVTISGKKLPIRCDIQILASLQEEFGTLNKFQQLLLGMRPVINRDGSIKYNSDGSIQFTRTEPSIKAIAYALPHLIREGIEKAEEQGNMQYSDTEWHEGYNDFDFDYVQMAVLINEEFERCFYRKKKTIQSHRKSRKRTQSTSTES